GYDLQLPIRGFQENGDNLSICLCDLDEPFIMLLVHNIYFVDMGIVSCSLSQCNKIVRMGKKTFFWVVLRVGQLIRVYQPERTTFAKLILKGVNGILVDVRISRERHQIAYITQFHMI